MTLIGTFRRRIATLFGARSNTSIREIEVVPVDGAVFTTFEQGSGPAILMLHAGSSNWTAWQLVALRLRNRFRLLAFDRRPYSNVTNRVMNTSIHTEVDDVLAVARLIGEPILLVGHSSGAIVALEAALCCPLVFSGLVLYEPPVAVTTPLGGEALRRARAALDAGDPDRAMEIHAREIAQAPAYLVRLQRLIRPLLRHTRKYASGQIIDDEQIESLGVGLDRFRSLDVPTLLIGGTKSSSHLRERLSALEAVLPCVKKVVILAGQGHFATVFAPGKVAQVIADFADHQNS